MTGMMIYIIQLFLIGLIAVVSQDNYHNRGWSIEHWPMNTDQSEQCQTCTDFFIGQENLWQNDTAIADLIKKLDKECDDTFSIKDLKKRELCEKIAGLLVELGEAVVPQLGEGMMSLSWPIPEGLCATLYQCSVDCTLDRTAPPAQVHLSFSQSTEIMGVTWVTYNQTTSVVEYSESEQDISSGDATKSFGDVITYLASDWKGNIHRAKLTGLKQGTKYYYRVGNGDDSWSNVFYFTTLVDLADITFAVLGDMDFESNTTMANIGTLAQNGDISAVIITGDISYADGYEPHWDRFFERTEQFAAYVPFMATPGNHEFWYNFTTFKKRFYFPGVIDEGGSGDNMFYSWNAGHAHFISSNSESAVDTAEFSRTFLDWFQSDIQAVDRSVYPFVITFFHRPMYCSNDNACTNKGGEALRILGEDIFNDNKVNLVLTGHVHSYERTYPIYKMAATQFDYKSPKNTVHIVQGASGNRESNDGFPSNLPDWSAARASEVGFGLMTVKKDAVQWSFYASRYASDGGPYLVDPGFTLQPWGA